MPSQSKKGNFSPCKKYILSPHCFAIKKKEKTDLKPAHYNQLVLLQDFNENFKYLKTGNYVEQDDKKQKTAVDLEMPSKRPRNDCISGAAKRQTEQIYDAFSETYVSL